MKTYRSILPYIISLLLFGYVFLCQYHRAEVRSNKLCSIDVDEKLKLGRELRQMDREQDRLEAELTKYQEKEVF